ncbi:YccF domain-containing protein [Butyrivibrio sp. ob235]|uniref:YccF domain-containing protein n=1 Tax=Butyrivibrio sp. ob235 TaxID=1761780 RepID=UPI000AD2F502|nr:YccF domain-containing protein [Butyrivibrio sp. ob235]
MRFLGNIIWFVFGGLLSAIAWWITGLLWCITVVGIPFGKQLFKIAKVALMPFGAKVVRKHYL